MNAAKKILYIIFFSVILAFLLLWAFPNLGLGLIAIEIIVLAFLLWFNPARSDPDSDQGTYDDSQEIKFEIFK